MTKNIVKVEDKKKSSKIDLGKIKDAIVDNKDTIVKIVDIATDLLDDDKNTTNKSNKKKTTSSKGTKSSSNKTKTTKKASKSKSSDLETVIDIAGKLFK